MESIEMEPQMNADERRFIESVHRKGRKDRNDAKMMHKEVHHTLRTKRTNIGR